MFLNSSINLKHSSCPVFRDPFHLISWFLSTWLSYLLNTISKNTGDNKQIVFMFLTYGSHCRSVAQITKKDYTVRHFDSQLYNLHNILNSYSNNSLKGVFAKNKRGYRLNAIKSAFDLTSICCVYKEKIVKNVSYRIT